MLVCPACTATLDRTISPRGIAWICPACKGRAVNLSLLRRLVEQRHFNRLWQTAWEGVIHTDRKCPSCHKPMVEVPLRPPPDPLVLDACKSCQFIWLDASELEKIPPAPPPPPTEKDVFYSLPLDARAAIAEAKVREIAEQARREERPRRREPETLWDLLPDIVNLFRD